MTREREKQASGDRGIRATILKIVKYCQGVVLIFCVDRPPGFLSKQHMSVLSVLSLATAGKGKAKDVNHSLSCGVGVCTRFESWLVTKRTRDVMLAPELLVQNNCSVCVYG